MRRLILTRRSVALRQRDERGAVSAFVIIMTVTLLSAGLLTAQLSILYSDYSTARQFAQAAARNAAILDDDATRTDADGDGFADFGNGNVMAEARENALGYLEFGATGSVPADAVWCGRSNAPQPICGGGTIIEPGDEPGTVQVTLTYQSRSIIPGVSIGQFTATGTASQRYTDQPIN
jgi:hypothetical protein